MEQLQEVKQEYYEYVNKVANGCMVLAEMIRNGSYVDAFEGIINFAEGVQWLVTVESALEQKGYRINSRITEANEFLMEINEGLESEDFITVADIFEYEIQPLFNSASEWVFEKK